MGDAKIRTIAERQQAGKLQRYKCRSSGASGDGALPKEA